jgi:hypothetical protein
MLRHMPIPILFNNQTVQADPHILLQLAASGSVYLVDLIA